MRVRSVLAFACLISLAILLIAAPDPAPPISFAGRRDIPAGTNPYGTVVGDFNGDGKPDMVVTNSSANTISIMLGNGDGSFQLPATKSVGGAARGIASGDFNGDGKLDVVTRFEQRLGRARQR